MSVAIIDTSVLCECWRSQASRATRSYRAQLKEKSEREILLLPMTTILETGNHIGQCSSDGGVRRTVALLFAASVRQAVEGKAPFSPTPFFDPDSLRSWLNEFPNWTNATVRGKGSGLGDLSIKKEWERQCELNRGRRVYIWSQDAVLAAYDREPMI